MFTCGPKSAKSTGFICAERISGAKNISPSLGRLGVLGLAKGAESGWLLGLLLLTKSPKYTWVVRSGWLGIGLPKGTECAGVCRVRIRGTSENGVRRLRGSLGCRAENVRCA